MDSLAFLDKTERARARSVYAVAGDEPFLKRHALRALRNLVLGADEAEASFTTFPGDKASRAAVLNELETLPFLSPRRLVLIESADPFVTRERAWLEKYVAAPASAGVLVLEVQSWPANTRLAKLLPDDATIVCKAPSPNRLTEWCRDWCASQYDKQLASAAAQHLVDLVGPEMGQLDQDLSKLALYVGKAARIETADVDTLVGNSRAENTWKIFELIGAGRAREALALLERLFDQGEDPHRLLGAFSHQLRRLAQAGRLHARGMPPGKALEKAGILPFGLRSAETQMRHLGRHRLDRLYDWLLETDFGFKGASQLPPRTLLERLVVQLARPSATAPPTKK